MYRAVNDSEYKELEYVCATEDRARRYVAFAARRLGIRPTFFRVEPLADEPGPGQAA